MIEPQGDKSPEEFLCGHLPRRSRNNLLVKAALPIALLASATLLYDAFVNRGPDVPPSIPTPTAYVLEKPLIDHTGGDIIIETGSNDNEDAVDSLNFSSFLHPFPK